jgi:hypothetical protein
MNMKNTNEPLERFIGHEVRVRIQGADNKTYKYFGILEALPGHRYLLSMPDGTRSTIITLDDLLGIEFATSGNKEGQP